MRRVRVLAAIPTFLASLLVPTLDPSPAWAAAPTNDSFADAQVVSGVLPLGLAGTNVEATKEAGEPNHGGNAGGRSVWYRWTPDATVVVIIETCAASGFDTLLAVYTGDAVNALTLVAGNDDGCSVRSRVTFTAVAGQTYSIAVDGFNGASGAFQLGLRASLPGPNAPPNDQFAAAQVVSGPSPIDVVGSNVDASKEPFEPAHAGNVGGASIWYSWVAETSGVFVAETCGSGIDTVLGVYTGASVDALTTVASNDNSSNCANNRHSEASFEASAGTTYKVAVDGAGGVTGTVALRVRAANPPANDDFADAQELGTALPVLVTGTNVEATKEPGEPNHAGNASGVSVWYRFTPDVTGPYRAQTCDISVNTVLAVYTGTSVDALTPVASNDNTSNACNQGTAGLSSVVFDASAGTTYHLVVDGANGSTGTIALQLRAANPPANDDFAAAQVLSGTLPINASGTNVDANLEPGEPVHADAGLGGASIWYRWTAVAGGAVVMETCQTSVNTLLAVYTGEALDGLVLVARNDNTTNCGSSGFGSRVTFNAQAGTTYRIAVDGRNASMGTIGVTVRSTGAPPNDDFAGAVVLAGPLPLGAGGSNVDATKEAGEPAHAGNAGGHSLWYRWTPEASQLVVLETCNSTINTLLAVYTGETVLGLAPVAANDDTGGCPGGGLSVRGSRVLFPAAAGTTYQIAVDGFGGAVGTVQLALRAANPPANDAFADAQPMAGPLPLVVTGTNVDATKQAGEPNHNGNVGGASVWYSWTADVSGTLVVTTCESTLLGALVGVYTGDAVDALTPVAAILEAPCGVRRQLRFTATAGQTYRIAVDGSIGETGSFVLAIRRPPSNDNFADAQVLSGPLPIDVAGSTLVASGEAGEPAHAGWSARQSIWYRWTAQASGWVAVETCDSTFDTVLGVYTGATVTTLTSVAANDNGCQFRQSRVVFSAVAGQTYHIAVDGPTQLGTDVGLRIRTAAPPANDDFGDAQVLSGVLPVNVVGTNVDATRQTGEPNHAGQPGGGSLWYRWTAPATEAGVVVDLCDSRFDTVVAVYTGEALADLAPVAGNDNRCGSEGGSYVRFAATSGQTYWIAVDGKFGARGTVVMALRLAPPNDDFAAAQALSGPLPIAVHGDNRDSALEVSEPKHTSITPSPERSVWYTWTPQVSGPVVIESCGRDQALAVYTGNTLAALAPVGSYPQDTLFCGLFERAKVALDATAGTTYRIAAAAVDWGEPFELSIHAPVPAADPPANDAFADAQVLTGALPIQVSGTNVQASKEAEEPAHGGNASGSSVWYTWTADVSGPIAVETCTSFFDTLLGVYTGDSVGVLTPLAEDDDGCGLQSRVTFTATLGQTYRIAVDGYAGRTGDIDLLLGRAEPPPNDLFADAQPLGGPLPITATGTNFRATEEQAEPEHTDSSGPNSIWYRWTPSTSGPVVVETCGSDFFTALAVYAGTALNALTPVTSGDCRVLFGATAGTTYQIAVAGRGSAVGVVALTVRAAQPPANDDFADAEELAGPLPVTISGTTADASTEPGEPDHDGSEHDDARATIWYRWTATISGPVVFETCGSDFRTAMGIYTGTTVDTLTPVPDDDSSCGLHAEIRRIITAEAGVTYRIAVAGYGDPAGSITLRLRAAPPPDNDDVVDAQVLGGALPITVSATNADATIEPFEPLHGLNVPRASVWFRWTAVASGLIEVDTCASDFSSVMSVYTGSSMRNLTDVARQGVGVTYEDDPGCDVDGRRGRFVFAALAGENYWIAVDGSDNGFLRDGVTGGIVLKLLAHPANDGIGNARAIDVKQPPATGTNVMATREPGEPAILGNDGGHSVWYRFTPATSGSYVVDTCDSSFDTLLGVFTGRAVNRLTAVASDDNSCGGQSRAKFNATAGQTYWFSVDGVDGATGSIRVLIRPDKSNPK